MFVYKDRKTIKQFENLAYFLRKIQTLRVNNLTILNIKNGKFSGYYLYMSQNI